MTNEFSSLVVDNLRKSRCTEKNKWKVDGVESFKRRSYMVQESDDGTREAEPSGDGRSQISSKSSIDDELPELVVFLQETNYEFVKDICIDKAVTSHEKCFEENCDTENGHVLYLLKYNKAESEGESTEESEDLESSTSSIESTQVLEKDYFDKVNEKQKVHYDEIDEIPSDVPSKKTVPKLFLDRKVTGKKTAASTNSIAISLNKILDENKHKGKAAARSNIEHKHGSNFRNSNLLMNTIGGGGSGCGHCHECGSTSTAENYAPEDQTGPYRSHGFVYQREDSSPALDPDPAFNPVRKHSLSSYLGSTSRRSNSSTNSSHSFAFPILQTEWNGSPERMVSTDPVQRRRRQLWRICFPCCNF